MKTKQIKAIILSGTIVVIVAVSVYFTSFRSNSEVLSARIGPIVEAIYGLGTVIAPRTYRVKTAVNTTVKHLYVKEGDQVKTNDLLVQFDDALLMRAPFSGTVTSTPYREGEMVTPLSPVLTVVSKEGLYLEIALEQQLILRVRPGQKAMISFESLRNERLQGVVYSVFSRDGQFLVRVEMSKFPEGVLPGMTADAAIITGKKDNVLMIPIRALFAGYVTVKNGVKAKKLPVTIGVVDGEWAELTSNNLSINDRLLVREK